MGSKRVTDPLDSYIGMYSGSIDTFKAPRWTTTTRREFARGDLVTLAPEFRYSITMSRHAPDTGRYVGIIVKAYANREYMVIWTNHPTAAGSTTGMFNGDHLIKVENAVESAARDSLGL